MDEITLSSDMKTLIDSFNLDFFCLEWETRYFSIMFKNTYSMPSNSSRVLERKMALVIGKGLKHYQSFLNRPLRQISALSRHLYIHRYPHPEILMFNSFSMLMSTFPFQTGFKESAHCLLQVDRL